MNLSSVDLNLLVAFDVLYKEGSVSVAARRLELSQPAMSNALGRLRKLFDDPLFIRSGSRMQPTPYAELLAQPISRACELLDQALRSERAFDPATSSRKLFTLYVSEVGELVFLPRILQALQTEAPRIDVKVSRVPMHGAYEAMAAGDVDLAIGIFPGLISGFYQQLLYEDYYVCLAREQHRSVRGSLSLAQYCELSHAVVADTGTGHDTVMEQVLTKNKLQRRIGVTVPHFLVLPRIVQETELIATVPSRMVKALPAQSSLQWLEPPVAIPKMQIRQYWHERFHKDPASLWLRRLVLTLLKE